MWHEKSYDQQILTSFIENLTLFHELKETKWEKIEDQVQMAINPGVPGEDWIIPPDEEKTEACLKKDPEYIRLRDALTKAVPELKRIAHFLHFDEHHDLDWVNFTNPLIGNEALEDGLVMAGRLLKACNNKNYIFQNLVNLVQIGD